MRRPKSSDAHTPRITIENKRFLSRGLLIARLGRGSKRIDANTRAAQTVPIIPAIFPNRKATYKITSKNNSGTAGLSVVPEKTGTKHPATAVQDAAPKDERNQPITCH